MIVRMQRYQAKEAILQLARSKGGFNFRDMKVTIFPDLTAEMAKKRANFKDIRIKLWEADVKHGLLFPATLIVTFNGKTKLFQDDKAAETDFNEVIKPALAYTAEEGDGAP